MTTNIQLTLSYAHFPAHGNVPPTVRMALPTSVNPVHSQRFVLQVVIEPSKVTVLAITRVHIELEGVGFWRSEDNIRRHSSYTFHLLFEVSSVTGLQLTK